jgi:hypothetical protein
MNKNQKQSPPAQFLQPISEFAFFDRNSGTLVELGHYDSERFNDAVDFGGDVGRVFSHQGLGNAKIKWWGTDNLLPIRRDALLMSNDKVGEIISSKRDLLIGQGIQAYTETYDEKGEKKREYMPLPDNVAKWLRSSKWEKKYLQNATLNYFKHANVFVEFMKAKDGSLLWMKSHDCKTVRAAEKINGVIPGYFLCADWSLPITSRNTAVEENHVVYVPAMPDVMDVKELPDHFIMHFGDETFDDGYYFHPPYWGGEYYIELSNIIAIWHKGNMENGASPRFHIKIPRGYFLDKTSLASAKTPEERAACYNAEKTKQQKFIDEMNNFLAGVRNAGRAVFTIDDFNQITKGYDGITIEEIKFDMKDDSLIKLYDACTASNVAAQGFPTVLAGIETNNKLSSGSEVRNILMYFIISKLPRRRRDILSPFELMLEINGWYDPNIKYTFEDILITKLDENKAGVSSTAEVPNEIPK